MRVLFNVDGRAAYTVDGICAVPSGMVVAEIPEALRKYPLSYLRLTGDSVVLDVSDNPSVQIINGEVVPTTAVAQAKKWDAIKIERDRRRFEGGVKVGGHWFLSTSTAISEYNSLLLMSAGLPETAVLRKDWRTMDGALVDMTPALVKQILPTGFAQAAAIDDAALTHKTAMEASPDPAAYDYSDGWPEMFVYPQP